MQNSCDNSSILSLLVIVKRIISLIQIVVPILLIIFGIITFVKLLNNPEEKNGIKKVINQFFAAAIVFFIPFIIDILMNVVGFHNNLSSCWINADDELTEVTKYYEVPVEEKKPISSNAEDYESGSSGDGLALARLAVRIVPTAAPEARIIHHANLHMGVDRATIDPRMRNYIKIMDATTTKYMVGDWNGSPQKHYFNNPNAATVGTDYGYNNNTYCSCTQSTGAIVRASVDPDFDMGGDPSKYLNSHPEKWTFVGYIRTGQKFDDVCQPGDVLSVQRAPITTHVMLYVGNEIVRERFPNSNANIYQGGYNAANVEQSWCPHLDYVESVDARRQYFEIWRPTGGGENYYPLIDVDAVLNGELQTGYFWK